jgi:hypothetical protein
VALASQLLLPSAGALLPPLFATAAALPPPAQPVGVASAHPSSDSSPVTLTSDPNTRGSSLLPKASDAASAWRLALLPKPWTPEAAAATLVGLSRWLLAALALALVVAEPPAAGRPVQPAAPAAPLSLLRPLPLSLLRPLPLRPRLQRRTLLVVLLLLLLLAVVLLLPPPPPLHGRSMGLLRPFTANAAAATAAAASLKWALLGGGAAARCACLPAATCWLGRGFRNGSSASSACCDGCCASGGHRCQAEA